MLLPQVKPLLEVTKQEEKLTQKEDELRQIRDKLDTQMKRCQEYEQKYQQSNAEKTQLAEQLQVSIFEVFGARVPQSLGSSDEMGNTTKIIKNTRFILPNRRYT